jgi:hypothetical protein
MNGTLVATIDSPTRKNRCVVPDKKEYDTKTTYQAHKQEQTPVIKTTKEDKHNETTSKNTPTRTTTRTKYEQGKGEEQEQETEQHYNIKRRNMTTTSKNKKDTKTEETKTKTRTKSVEEEDTKIVGIQSVVSPVDLIE